jgi:hypothetical protein
MAPLQIVNLVIKDGRVVVEQSCCVRVEDGVVCITNIQLLALTMKMAVTKTQLFWLPRAIGIHFRATRSK